MRQKCGGVKQRQNSTNALQDSQNVGIMVQVKSQDDEKLFRRTKENHEWPSGIFEKIDSRLKSLEDDIQFLTEFLTEEI